MIIIFIYFLFIYFFLSKSFNSSSFYKMSLIFVSLVALYLGQMTYPIRWMLLLLLHITLTNAVTLPVTDLRIRFVQWHVGQK